MKKILILLFLGGIEPFFVFSQSSEMSKIPLVVTWKNEAGFWRAVGPVQNVSFGVDSEEKAIGTASNVSKNNLSFIITIGKYNIYALHRYFEYRGEVDARDFLSQNGISFDNTRLLGIWREIEARKAIGSQNNQGNRVTTGTYSDNSQQTSASKQVNGALSALPNLQTQQAQQRQEYLARQAQIEQRRNQLAAQQRQTEQRNAEAMEQRRHQEEQRNQEAQNQRRQQEDAQNKVKRNAEITAYYAQKRAEIYQKGANDLANIAKDAISYFSAQKQASEENRERARQEALAEERAEKERMEAEKAERESIMAERAERERLERERLEAERTYRLSSRNSVFDSFKEADIPLSNSNKVSDKLFYFIYAYDRNNIGEDNFVVFLSAPFEIDRFSDGTWPYKKNIVNEISQLTPYAEILHGYYTSLSEANQMNQSFKELLSNSKTVINPIFYKGKISSSGSVNSNFWGEPTKNEANTPTNNTPSGASVKSTLQYDFWGNPVKK